MRQVENEKNTEQNGFFIVSSTRSCHWSVITNRRGQTLGHLVLPEHLIIVDVPLFVSPPERPAFECAEEDLIEYHEELFLNGEYPKWLDAGYRLESCEDISAACDQIVIAARLEASYSDARDLMRLIRFADNEI
jgi:hypothetical protein